jgi:hypothetical protein
MFNTLLCANAHEFVYSGDKTLLDDLIAGRARPGILEKSYYERFERPWEESKGKGRT